ncbi:MAG TPA: MMPL family transporter [Acidimicrobiales bacterium]|nr:MMPL family transporter [Acidimicrobiales bacterium]
MRAVARWCFVHRRIVVLAWMLALVLSAGAAKSAGSHFTTKFQLGGTPSAHALSLLERDFPAASGSSDQIVLQARSGQVRSSAVEAQAAAMLGRVAALPHVRSVASPFSPAGAHQVSPDGTIAYATVVFDGQSGSIPKSAVRAVIQTAESARSPLLSVDLGGQDIEQANQQSGSSSTLLGVVFALIVLGIAFGALFVTPLPIVTALLSIGIGISLTELISHVMSVASFGTILDALIGLGVGVDYALFIVTRHRAALKAGAAVEDAVVGAVNTAGRAVFFAGITVCIALLGQFVLGLPFLYGIAVSASLTVILTMLSSITLLPALLGFIGMRALSRGQRRSLEQEGPHDEAMTGLWFRWARFLEGRPLVPLLGALVAVVVIALPVTTLRLGLDDAGTDAPGTTTLAAYQELARGFGPGSSGPLQLVAILPATHDDAAFTHILGELRGQRGISATSPAIMSPNGEVAIANVIPSSSPQSSATTALVHRLRDQILPAATAGSGTTVLVGGATAIGVDFAHVLSGKLVYFIGVVVLLGFLLLMAVFRSLVIPTIASVMNLLSVGASLGIMNAVFEWGYGHSLFKISEKAPVQVFIPVIILSILFGLSMDYEVFLVSRIHEEWVRRRDNTEAVTIGQGATGRVITAAASIMILVFAGFALGDNVIIKQFGIGLAGAIVVDAFLVRTVIVPASMQLIGRANWWLPSGLERALPQLNVEGSDGATGPGDRGLATV